MAALVVLLIKLRAHLLFLGQVEATQMCPDQDLSCIHSLLVLLTGIRSDGLSVYALGWKNNMSFPFEEGWEWVLIW